MTDRDDRKKRIKDQAVEKYQIARVKRDCDEIQQLSGDPKIKV